jgi:aspartate aminotransferase
VFEKLPRLPLDPIFKLQADYVKDTNPHKVNLGIGLYADENGNPVVLDTVKKAFSEVDINDFNYQPISGNPTFLNLASNLIFNRDLTGSLALQSTCGGTQAIRMFADLCQREHSDSTILIGLPTWGNHLAICKNLKIVTFDHLNESGFSSLENYKSVLTSAPKNSILLLHSGKTHNPTGQNLSINQILSLTDLIESKNIKILVDAAYFGFGTAINTEVEWFNQIFINFSNIAIAFSFSKNASLYEHRTGFLAVKTSAKEIVQSQLQQLARESISMAPGLGQEIMINILSNKKTEWLQEVEQIRTILNERRQTFMNSLSSGFESLKSSQGMFGLLNFTPNQIQRLVDEYSIYISRNGRLNFAGLNSHNMDYVISGINKILTL